MDLPHPKLPFSLGKFLDGPFWVDLRCGNPISKDAKSSKCTKWPCAEMLSGYPLAFNFSGEYAPMA